MVNSIIDTQVSCAPFRTGVVQATSVNKVKMKTCIDELFASGNTNYKIAFEKAFKLLKTSYSGTSKCHNVILFLTDGKITSGGDPFDLIKAENIGDFDTRIFTFGFGATLTSEDNKILQQIACENKGIWYSIKDGDQATLRTKMSSYYEYFAQNLIGEVTKVTWSELYIDFSGLGEMTTVALPCYKANGDLIGVAGIDVPVGELLAYVLSIEYLT